MFHSGPEQDVTNDTKYFVAATIGRPTVGAFFFVHFSRTQSPLHPQPDMSRDEKDKICQSVKGEKILIFLNNLFSH